MACQNVDCPRGFVCTAPEGICKRQPSHTDIPLTSEQLHADDPQLDKGQYYLTIRK